MGEKADERGPLIYPPARLKAVQISLQRDQLLSGFRHLSVQMRHDVYLLGHQELLTVRRSRLFGLTERCAVLRMPTRSYTT